MKNKLEFLKKNGKSLFCYLLIILGILFAILIFITKPSKVESSYLYSSGKGTELTEVSFPLEEKIQVDTDNLNGIYVYYGDDSINNYNYQITILNDDLEEISFFDMSTYTSNIAYFSFANLDINNGDTLTIKFTCEDCEGVQMNIGESVSAGTYITNTANKTLVIVEEFYVANNSYYWYSITIIVIALILLPLAKEEEKWKKTVG